MLLRVLALDFYHTLAALLVMIHLAGTCLGQEHRQEPEAVRIGESDRMDFDVRNLVALGPTGSIEILVSALDRGQGMVELLQFTDDEGSAFSVLVDTGRGQLAISDGTQSHELEATLTGSGFRHLALLTAGDRTAVFDVARGEFLGMLAVGYGPVRPTRLTLGTGARRGPSFDGWIGGIRIWDRLLDHNELRIGGRRSERTTEGLVLWSRFTSNSSQLLSTRRQGTQTSVAGHSVGRDVIREDALVPHGFVLAGLRAHLTPPPIPADPNTRFLHVPLGTVVNLAPLVVEEGAPLGGTVRTVREVQLSEIESRLQAIDRQSTALAVRRDLDSSPDGREAMAALSDVLQTAGRALAVERDRLSSIEQERRRRVAGTQVYEFRLRDDEWIHGIAGARDASLRSIRLLTNQRIQPTVAAADRVKDRLQVPYVVRLPAFTEVVGIRTWSTDSVHGLALLYDQRSEPHPEWENASLSAPTLIDLAPPGEFDPRGIFADEWTDEDPVRNDELARRNGMILSNGSVRPHGLFGFRGVLGSTLNRLPAYRARMDAQSGDIFLARESQVSGRDLLTDVTRLTQHIGDLYRIANADPSEVTLTQSLRFVDVDRFDYLGGQLRRPGLYPRAIGPEAAGGRDKMEWDSIFGAPERAPLLSANFKGYNIFALDPRTLQEGTGTSKLLFKYPSATSRDYYFPAERPGLIVPYGLLFTSEIMGTQSGMTEIAGTTRQYHHASTTGVGVSIGKASAGGTNNGYQNDLRAMAQSRQMFAMTTTGQYSHALVLDSTRMQLDDGFRRAVHHLRDVWLAGLEPNYPVFLATYGTHYPFAVTYGSIFRAEREFSEQDYAILRSRGISMGVDIGLEYDGIGAGISPSHTEEIAREHGHSISRETDRQFSLGGEIGSTGWHATRGGEVPLLLDLRSIDELLSPIHFDDPVVWETLRDEIRAELTRMDAQNTARLASMLGPDRAFRPDVVEVTTSLYLLSSAQLGLDAGATVAQAEAAMRERLESIKNSPDPQQDLAMLEEAQEAPEEEGGGVLGFLEDAGKEIVGLFAPSVVEEANQTEQRFRQLLRPRITTGTLSINQVVNAPNGRTARVVTPPEGFDGIVWTLRKPMPLLNSGQIISSRRLYSVNDSAAQTALIPSVGLRYAGPAAGSIGFTPGDLAGVFEAGIPFGLPGVVAAALDRLNQGAASQQQRTVRQLNGSQAGHVGPSIQWSSVLTSRGRSSTTVKAIDRLDLVPYRSQISAAGYSGYFSDDDLIRFVLYVVEVKPQSHLDDLIDTP